MLLATCLLLAWCPMVGRTSSAGARSLATAGTATVEVRLVDSAGEDAAIPSTFDHDQLEDVLGLDVTGAYYVERTARGYFETRANIQGVSILRALARCGALSTHVTHVDMTVPGSPPVLLTSASSLLAGSYLESRPPVLSPVTDSTDIELVINPRVPPTGLGGKTDNGGYVTAGNGQTITATVYLDGALLSPVVRGLPTTVPAEQRVDVTAGLAGGGDPGRYGWTWDFGDGGTATGSSTSHTFAKAGTYTVQAAAEGTGTDRSSGLSAPTTITVTEAVAVANPPVTPPPTSVTPSAQPSLGNGAPVGPNVGPVSGNGSRVGGAAGPRSGSGAPGPSYDPRSSAAAASGAAPDATAGGLVGQLLAGPDVPFAQPSQVAAKPLDDTAPAARSGVGPGLLGWFAGALVVVALLVLGAGTERRRPGHGRPHRRPHGHPMRRAR